MPFSIITAIAADASAIAVNRPQTIDFSTLDTLAGAVIAIAAMIVVGLILLKYGVVKIGEVPYPKGCELSQVPPCTEHSGMIKDIGFLAEECRGIWFEIKDINMRQMDLRSKLPEKYASKDDLQNIQAKLNSIDSKLDRYLELHVAKL